LPVQSRNRGRRRIKKLVLRIELADMPWNLDANLCDESCYLAQFIPAIIDERNNATRTNSNPKEGFSQRDLR